MRLLITAGPTREFLDDVRYLSNNSSGRMGFALAEAAPPWTVTLAISKNWALAHLLLLLLL